MADRYRILTCSVCGEEFVFTARGQDYFASIGYAHDPKRCKSCHSEHKRRQRVEAEMDGMQEASTERFG